jgi:hypothetical protein
MLLRPGLNCLRMPSGAFAVLMQQANSPCLPNVEFGGSWALHRWTRRR